MGLDPGVLDESRPGFLGLRQPVVLADETDLDPERLKQMRDLLQLALVVGRDQQPVPVKRRMSGDGLGLSGDQRCDALGRQVVHLVELPRLKAAPSALACTSISAPAPVMTKLLSVPASLSSA
jgi:hypothetical protein